MKEYEVKTPIGIVSVTSKELKIVGVILLIIVVALMCQGINSTAEEQAKYARYACGGYKTLADKYEGVPPVTVKSVSVIARQWDIWGKYADYQVKRPFKRLVDSLSELDLPAYTRAWHDLADACRPIIASWETE